MQCSFLGSETLFDNINYENRSKTPIGLKVGKLEKERCDYCNFWLFQIKIRSNWIGADKNDMNDGQDVGVYELG